MRDQFFDQPGDAQVADRPPDRNKGLPTGHTAQIGNRAEAESGERAARRRHGAGSSIRRRRPHFSIA
jgi:hypothetical protein